jgi:alanyl-tRNA synthetase
MVNQVRRHQTAANHTATHLLHNALRVILGEGVRQAGSYVGPERLRFDYTTRQAPSKEQLRQIEDLVNRRIVENHPVRAFETTREYAAELGAIAFFEEKYGEFVRVLEIDDFSRELCGGTHVAWTSEIGLCKITHSSSVGANTRRIEAVTSAKAIEYFRGIENQVNEIAAELKVPADAVVGAVRKQNALVEELMAKLRAAEGGAQRSYLDELLGTAEVLTGAAVVGGAYQGIKPDELLSLADEVRARQPEAVVVLGSAVDGRAALVVSVSDAVVGRGVHAHEIMKAMTPHVDGKGGGKASLARGGGANPDGVQAAVAAGLSKARELLGA